MYGITLGESAIKAEYLVEGKAFYESIAISHDEKDKEIRTSFT